MRSNGEIPYRNLGSPDERVSDIGGGRWHLALPQVEVKLALRIVRSAVDRGINFMDNSWDDNEGAVTKPKARPGFPVTDAKQRPGFQN